MGRSLVGGARSFPLTTTQVLTRISKYLEIAGRFDTRGRIKTTDFVSRFKVISVDRSHLSMERFDVFLCYFSKASALQYSTSEHLCCIHVPSELRRNWINGEYLVGRLHLCCKKPLLHHELFWAQEASN
jgi:hypothetical protein